MRTSTFFLFAGLVLAASAATAFAAGSDDCAGASCKNGPSANVPASPPPAGANNNSTGRQTTVGSDDCAGASCKPGGAGVPASGAGTNTSTNSTGSATGDKPQITVPPGSSSSAFLALPDLGVAAGASALAALAARL